MTSATGAPPEQEPAGGISEPEMVQRSFRVFIRGIRRFLNRTLDIRDDANIDGTIETIHKDMVFRGPNVWVLVCSIFIASIGLNTNSAAVIIGAMLISPLMGPILAIGLSVGMNDIDVLRRAVRNFAVMVAVALFTSTLYFLITPLGDVQSELLARTRPTLLDALIAIFGGIAGIIGVSRRDRGNVIPGVAIATALMPPLCTAGYGLANGNWPFFFGASYLFALNSIFIAISTVMIVRFLHFPFVKFIDSASRRRVRMRIAVFVAVVLLPSTWVLYGVVRESLWRARAAEFLSANILNLTGVDVINQRLEYADSLSRIDVFLAGDTVPMFLEQQLQTRMAQAGLGNTSLRLHQPQDIRGELGRLSSELRVGIVQDLYERNALALAERDQRIRELEGRLLLFERDTIPLAQITREIVTQYPTIERIAFGRVIEMREAPPESDPPDTARPDTARAASTVIPLAPPRIQDTIPTFMVRWNGNARAAQRAQDAERLASWLKVRLALDTVRVIGN